MSVDNPYTPPPAAAQGAVPHEPPRGISTRSAFFRGVYLVFRLLALFSLVRFVEEALRLSISYLLVPGGSGALTVASSIIVILGVAARLFLLLWTLRQPPDRSPLGWGAPIGWAVVFLLSGIGTTGLSTASTMLLTRLVDIDEVGPHLLAINIIGTVRYAFHVGLMVLGLLIAFRRWRAAS
jgi:hypothetical protein